MVTLVTVVCEDAQMNKMLKIMVTLVTEVTLNQIENLWTFLRMHSKKPSYFGNYGNLGNYLDFSPFQQSH